MIYKRLLTIVEDALYAAIIIFVLTSNTSGFVVTTVFLITHHESFYVNHTVVIVCVSAKSELSLTFCISNY